jgi:hypothetical protein
MGCPGVGRGTASGAVGLGLWGTPRAAGATGLAATGAVGRGAAGFGAAGAGATAGTTGAAGFGAGAGTTAAGAGADATGAGATGAAGFAATGAGAGAAGGAGAATGFGGCGGAAASAGASPPCRVCRTFSATSTVIELECVFFSVTPKPGSRSIIALALTSSSRASSLIRTWEVSVILR